MLTPALLSQRAFSPQIVLPVSGCCIREFALSVASALNVLRLACNLVPELSSTSTCITISPKLTGTTFCQMEKAQQEKPEVRAQGGEEGETLEPGHHFAAPEVEEWAPHPYEIVGTHRKESLKGDLPEEKTEQPPAAE